MPNTLVTPSIFAAEAVMVLENALVMGNQVYRGYEDEFNKKVNGYDVGDTIQIRKPQQFSVRTGAVASNQDIQEGKLTLQVSLQKGIDFKLSGTELSLKIEDLSDRIIKPALVRLANQVDVDVMSLIPQIPNWVGQPATGADAVIDSFAKFARAAERLDQNSCPQDQRSAVLSPDSWWALAGSQTGLFVNSIAQPSYRQGEIGDVAGVQTFMSQNVPSLTLGTGADDSPTVTGAQSTTWASVMNTESTPGQMSLVTGSWGTTNTIKAGTVITIGSGATAVLAVNQVTKAVLPYQQQFTVLSDVTASGGAATLTITPPIIPIGSDPAFGTVSQGAGAGASIQVLGAASGAYRQNCMFHKNAFALVMVPMVRPPGAVDVARKSYKGCSVRVVPYYDGPNDISNYRLDILYGVKVVDNRLACRMTGGTGTLGNPSA